MTGYTGAFSQAVVQHDHIPDAEPADPQGSVPPSQPTNFIRRRPANDNPLMIKRPIRPAATPFNGPIIRNAPQIFRTPNQDNSPTPIHAPSSSRQPAPLTPAPKRGKHSAHSQLMSGLEAQYSPEQINQLRERLRATRLTDQEVVRLERKSRNEWASRLRKNNPTWNDEEHKAVVDEHIEAWWVSDRHFLSIFITFLNSHQTSQFL